MSNDLLGKYEVLQVNGSKALARNKFVLRCNANYYQSAEETEEIPTCLRCPLCEEMWLPRNGSYHSSTTAISSYLFVSSLLASGPLPRAVLLRLSSVLCSV